MRNEISLKGFRVWSSKTSVHGRLEPVTDSRHRLRAHFSPCGVEVQHGLVKGIDWRLQVPAVPGALQACELLSKHGYELVCVTALDERWGKAREINLRSLGFPIQRGITPHMQKTLESPKAAALRELQPLAFVDDFAPYLIGVSSTIHKALVVRDPKGSPNTPKMQKHADSQHSDLLGFAQWWIEQGKGR